MLVRGRTSRLPGHNEVRYIRGGVATPPPRKAQATMNCRAPVVCLVTVPVSCLDTVAVLGGETPRTPPSSTGCLLSHSTCIVFGHSNRAGGETPPDPHPRARPLVLGHRFCLVLGHSRCAGGGHPPDHPPRARPLVLGHIFIYLFSKKGEEGENKMKKPSSETTHKKKSSAQVCHLSLSSPSSLLIDSARVVPGTSEGKSRESTK